MVREIELVSPGGHLRRKVWYGTVHYQDLINFGWRADEPEVAEVQEPEPVVEVQEDAVEGFEVEG